MSKPVLMLGAGGHARVLIDILLSQDREIIGLVSPFVGVATEFIGIKHFSEDDDVFNFCPTTVELVNAIGSLPKDASLREKLFNRFTSFGYAFAQVIASSAFVSPFAELAEGVQVLPGAVVNGCRIGENSIINSGAIIEHDASIGPQCHVAPGAIVCGNTTLSKGVHIGAGATVIQSIYIGTDAIVGAGSVVTKNMPERAICYPPKAFMKRGSEE